MVRPPLADGSLRAAVSPGPAVLWATHPRLWWPRPPDPASAANQAVLAQHLRETRARLGFAFDGDATRCLVMDAEGCEIEPDLIACLFMRLDPEGVRSGIAVDPDANPVVEQVARNWHSLSSGAERSGPSADGDETGPALGIEMEPPLQLPRGTPA